MKFKGTIGTQYSGSLAGVTASHNRGGYYYRQRIIPVNTNTPLQQEVRAIFGGLSIAWSQELTGAQRLAWDNYAELTPITNNLGDTITVSGKNMFIAGNTLRLQGGTTRLDDGPTTPGRTALSVPSAVVFDTGASPILTITLAAGDEWAGQGLGRAYLFQGRSLGPAIGFYKGPFRLVNVTAGNLASPPTSITADTFPYPVIQGNRTYFRLIATDEQGRISNEVIFSDVAA